MAPAPSNGREVGRDQVATATLHLLGIALKDDLLWVSETGKIALYRRDAQGRYGERKEIVTGIPAGLHQNDGFASGADGMLYWGLGSTQDRGPETHPWSGTIMRMNPDGSEVEVYARGFRNPYGILLSLLGALDLPSKGDVKIDGAPLTGLSGDRLADFRFERLGFIFQQYYLLPTMTALGNVMSPLLPRKVEYNKRHRADRIIRLVEGRMAESARDGGHTGGERSGC